MEEKKRVAILIDAENVQPIHADQVMEKAETLGTIVRKELYGAASALTGWVVPSFRYCLHTNLSIRTTKGKNTSDIALTIAAMDMLTEGNIDTMVIVSSDSDFSMLAVRLRSAGMTVVGMGSETVNPLWKIACSEFITWASTDVEEPAEPADDGQASEPEPVKEPAPIQDQAVIEERRAQILQTIEKQIEMAGGKIAASRLFLALNHLNAYQADKQLTGFKKAQQYLTTIFGQKLSVKTYKGNTWVSLKNARRNVRVQEEREELDEEEDAAAEQPTAVTTAQDELSFHVPQEVIDEQPIQVQDVVPETELSAMEEEPQAELYEVTEEEPQAETSELTEEEPQAEISEVMEEEPQVASSEATEEEPQTETSEATEEEPQAELSEAIEAGPQAETSEATEEEPQAETSEATEEEPQAETSEATEEEPQASEASKSEQFLLELLASGTDEETARVVQSIVESSANRFVAYNQLRMKFGNKAGNAYYHQALDAQML